ncbi:hypothetical protein ASPACDRAFT_57721 [Aspergillus aculeatus ATCC 16872]|uniref:Calcineurin-like phosphoesterase domain-containing protein n=1 Tax=Aspergillus aculeatus (strain ATCC 16872 / CBS 172.66 / WB 5094) TaxID=690307 RepID=A0A1L9X3G2_ASPA1|nr:uncharacterized protein ASPACDRAFT_57721 [Aspergillus aculeatus ATCC 16872]OJK02728.1 hypothetical protein ASPACDRAFT_57721 [Aspergillus aculeatus ATCC 16872]
MNRKQPTQKTTLLLLSDTHTLTPQPPTSSPSPASSPSSRDQDSSPPPPAFLDPLPAAEILIHAGDLTKVSRRHEHLTTLSYLKSHPAYLKLIIPGNHDITFDAPYYESLGHHRHRNRTDHTAPSATASATNISSGKAEPGQLEDPEEIRRLYTGPEAWDAGIRLLGEGVHEFELPGQKKRRLKVYASSWTPEFCQWAFGYERGVDRFNPPAASSSGTVEGKEVKMKEDGQANGGVDGVEEENPAIGTRTEEHHHHHHHTNGYAHHNESQNHNHQDPQPNETTAETRERTRTHGSTGSRGEGARGAIAANSGRGGFVAPAPIPDSPEGIDIVITHGPPYGILDQVVPNHVSVGCEHLYRAVKRARPRLHVFGHIHEGYGAMRREWSTGNDSIIQCDQPRTREEHCARVDVSKTSMMPLNPGQETLFVNASVVNVQYHPINAPWLVEMELPVVEGESG